MSPSTARVVELAALALGATIAIVLFLFPSIEAQAESISPPTTSTLLPPELAQEKAKLELDQLREQVQKLRLDNQEARSGLHSFLNAVPFLTAVIGGIGLLGTFWKQASDLSRQRAADMDLRQRELDQRTAEGRRRFDEQFTAVVQNLGAESTSLQASAAAALIIYLKPEYEEFREQVFYLLIAGMKVEREPVVARLLVRCFEQALPLVLSSSRPAELDLSMTNLVNGRFEGVNLEGIDVDLWRARCGGASFVDATLKAIRGGEIRLQGARLTGCNLYQARLNGAQAPEAQFHRSVLVGATLKDADLRSAEFQEASLQSAHLEGARLEGARFEMAELNDAYFTGAQFDNRALRSIGRARNWRKAHFSDDVLQSLEAMHAPAESSPNP